MSEEKPCQHDIADRETAVADGYCPQCLSDSLNAEREARMRAEGERGLLLEALISADATIRSYAGYESTPKPINRQLQKAIQGITDVRELISQSAPHALEEVRARVWEEAATEAEKPRTMFLTKADVLDGISSDDHPVIRARAQIRKEIADDFRSKAKSLRQRAGDGA